MSEKVDQIDSCFMATLVAETFRPGVVVADVARKHGISVNRLYNWRHKIRQAGKLDSKGYLPEAAFVELVPAGSPPSAKISKVMISFSSSTLSIDGQISASVLSKIIGLMGAEC
jgi:transposase